MKIGYYPFNMENGFISKQKKILQEMNCNLIEIKNGTSKVCFKKPDNPDILILNWLESGNGISNPFSLLLFYFSWSFIFLKCKLKGIKTVVVFHNKKPHNSKLLKSIVAKCFMFFIYRLSSAVIVLTEDSKQYLKNLVPKRKMDKVFVVPHTNYLPVEHIGTDSCNEKMTVGFVGLIKPYKNCEYIFQLAKEFEDCDITFKIMGEVPEKSYEKKLTEKSKNLGNLCFIPGYLSDKDIYKVVDSFDILVLPYDIESSMNSGIAIMAFSCGKPVICPCISTITDYPAELNYVYSYSDRNDHYQRLKEQLDKAYSDWITDRTSFKKKGFELYSLVKDYNSEEKVSEAYRKVLDYLKVKGSTNIET